MIVENNITKRRPHESSPVIGDNGLMTKPGDNAKYAGLIMKIMDWPEIDKKNIAALEQRLCEYLAFCAQNDMKIGNMGAYFALGITKGTARDWAQEGGGNSPRAHFIKKVKEICAYYRECLMQDGKVNPITGIFWQKNHDGFRDQSDLVITPNNPLGDAVDVNEIRQKYLYASPEATE